VTVNKFSQLDTTLMKTSVPNENRMV